MINDLGFTSVIYSRGFGDSPQTTGTFSHVDTAVNQSNYYLVASLNMCILLDSEILSRFEEWRSSPERILCTCVKGKQELEVCIYNTHTTAI